MGWNIKGTVAVKNAREQADYAKEQGDYAKSEASDLSDLKTNVETATTNANEATDNANNAASAANTAKTNADTAASGANTAKNNANAAATAANNAADNANTAASNANSKAAELEDRVNTAIADTTDSAEIIDARGGEATLGTRLDKINHDLSEQNSKTSILSHGMNVVETDTPSDLKVEFHGNTLTNLLGKDGGFENNSSRVYKSVGITEDTTIYKTGSKSLKVDTTIGDFVRIDNLILDSAKYYLLIGDIRISRYTSGTAPVLQVTDGGGTTNPVINQVSTTLLNTWQMPYVKFTGKSSARVYFGALSGSANVAFNIDGLRLFEINQATYDKIGVSLTDSDIQRMFPYVDSVQHVKNPVLTVEGSQLWRQGELAYGGYAMSGYSSSGVSWEYGDNLLLSNGGALSNTLDIAKTPIAISFTVEKNSSLRIYAGNNELKNGSVVGGSRYEFTFTPTESKTKLAFGSYNGDNLIKDIMLNLGSTAKPFVPYNPNYLYAETTLAGNNDKKDILYRNMSLNRWEIQRNFGIDDDLGSRNWSLHESVNGIYIVKTPLSNFVKNSQIAVKGDGTYLTNRNSYSYTKNNADSILFDDSYSDIFISILGTEAEGYNLTTTTGIQAYFGDKNYFLSYQLAEPVIEVEGIDFPYVEGDVSIQGDAIVEVGEGVVVREKVVPQTYTDSDYYWVALDSDKTKTSLLSHKIKDIVHIYRNGEIDDRWEKFTNHNSHGDFALRILKANYDDKANYEFTYEPLDKHAFTTNLNEVKATYKQSIKSSFSGMTSKVSDIATDVSINKRSLIDMYVRLKALESGVE